MEEKDVKEQQKEEKVITIKIPKVKMPKINFWMTSTIVLIIIVGFLLVQSNKPIGEKTGSFVIPTLTAENAVNKAIEWISDYFKANGQNVNITLINTSDVETGIYKFTIKLSSAQGDSIVTYYVTKDGKLFLPTAIDITRKISQQAEQQAQPTEIPKTDKPTVELFVMSFCPFGIQAENIMKPVFDLLGTKADIKVRFIANVQGTTADSVQSLHGTNEAMEDLRQLCIMKYYDEKTYWDYLMEVNKNCPSVYRDASTLDKCWKDAATKAGIDTTKIDSCSKSSEGLDLLKADEQLTEQYGVTGSPTLIINGVRYSGSRTSEAFKQAICSGFTDPPAECSQTLSSTTSSTSSGGCQ